MGRLYDQLLFQKHKIEACVRGLALTSLHPRITRIRIRKYPFPVQMQIVHDNMMLVRSKMGGVICVFVKQSGRPKRTHSLTRPQHSEYEQLRSASELLEVTVGVTTTQKRCVSFQCKFQRIPVNFCSTLATPDNRDTAVKLKRSMSVVGFIVR